MHVSSKFIQLYGSSDPLSSLLFFPLIAMATPVPATAAALERVCLEQVKIQLGLTEGIY